MENDSSPLHDLRHFVIFNSYNEVSLSVLSYNYDISSKKCYRLGLPIVLGYYVRYFEKNSLKIPSRGWMLGTGIVLISFFNLASHHYASVNCARIGMRVRIACSALIYRKVYFNSHNTGCFC